MASVLYSTKSIRAGVTEGATTAGAQYFGGIDVATKRTYI